jgi:ElaB/YqjD/DUF883 family membrane-anchored ribosome-binding protein
MSRTVVEKTAEHIADSAQQACRATNAVADAIEDGVGAEEFLNDTSQRIQRNPVLTVAATFAIGLAAGTLIGWTLRRR